MLLPIGRINKKTTVSKLFNGWLHALESVKALNLFYRSGLLPASTVCFDSLSGVLKPAKLIKDEIPELPTHFLSSKQVSKRNSWNKSAPNLEQLLTYYQDNIDTCGLATHEFLNVIHYTHRKYQLLIFLSRQINRYLQLCYELSEKGFQNTSSRLSSHRILANILKSLYLKVTAKTIENESQIYRETSSSEGTAHLNINKTLTTNLSSKTFNKIILLILRRIALNVLFMVRISEAKTIGQLQFLYELRAFTLMPAAIERHYLQVESIPVGAMLFTFCYFNQHRFPLVYHVQLLAEPVNKKLFHAYIGRYKSRVGVTSMGHQPQFFLVVTPRDKQILQNITCLMTYFNQWHMGFDFKRMRQATVAESNRLYGPKEHQCTNNELMLVEKQKSDFNKKSLIDMLTFTFHYLLFPEIKPENTNGFFCSSIVLLIYQIAYFIPYANDFLVTTTQTGSPYDVSKSLAHRFFNQLGATRVKQALPKSLRLPSQTTAPFTLARALKEDADNFEQTGYLVQHPSF